MPDVCRPEIVARRAAELKRGPAVIKIPGGAQGKVG
jgi:hypothetical protein